MTPTPTTEDLDQWLTDISPVINAGQLRRIGDTTWFIDLDEYTDLELKLDEPGNKLVLTTSLGTPTLGEELKTYETLLLVNGLWAETGGVRMALDSPGGAVDQIFDLPLAGLEKEDLLTRIENFNAAAHQWRAIIASGPNDREDGEASFDPGSMIRV